MESHTGDKMPEKATQAKLPLPPPTQPLQADPADHKRKRGQKSQDVVEGGKGPLAKETEPKKGAKQAKVAQTLVNKRGDSQVGTPA